MAAAPHHGAPSRFSLGRPLIVAVASTLGTLPLALSIPPAGAAETGAAPVFPTYGVHNPPSVSPCAKPDCIYARSPDQPTDPIYPAHWTSRWNMYRVFHRYPEFPPPYAGVPPAPLQDGRDYETSYGQSFYDADWRGPSGTGAMMERYDKRCLPIFPIPNTYSCAFISLGDTAFFVTYPQDRPKGMPPVCLFSNHNHPPRPDFISHLPYAEDDGRRLGGRVQGYSFWISHSTGKPEQVGAAPDRTDDGYILFGYGFESIARPDAVDRTAAPYRHPQSFYFSGFFNQDPPKPPDPPDAPIVSQNYTDFAIAKPDPKQTWNLVDRLDPARLPVCKLFNPDPAAVAASPASFGATRENVEATLRSVAAANSHRRPTWGDLGPR